MIRPPHNAADAAWEDYLRECPSGELLSVWAEAAENGDQRIKDMALTSAGCRLLAMIMRDRCLQAREEGFPCAQ